MSRKRARHGGHHLLAIATFILAASTPGVAARPFEVDDIFRPESVGSVAFGGPYAFSRDGRRLAVVRVRPWSSAPAPRHGTALRDLDRSDVWVQLGPGAGLTNITNGETDESGWWSPSWSPDGTRLALISSRGGRLALWIWNSADGSLTRLASHSPLFGDGQPLAWIDDHRIVYATQPAIWDGMSNVAEESLRTVTDGWRRAVAGDAPTSDVLQNGALPRETTAARDAAGGTPTSRLVLIDMAAGTETALAAGLSPIWRPSPTGVAIAWVADAGIPGSAGPAIGVAGVMRRLPALTGPIPARVVQGCLSWSRDGSRVAALGYDAADRLGLYVVTTQTGRIALTPLPDLWAGSCLSGGIWSAQHGVLFRAKRRADVQASSIQTARNDWWYVGARNRAVNLTSGMGAAPRRLFPAIGAGTFVGAAGGEIWLISPEAGTVSNLTQNIQAPVRDIVWPSFFTSNDSGPVSGREYPEVIAALGDGRAGFISIDPRAGHRPAMLGNPAGRLVAYAPATRSAAMLSSDSSHLSLSRTDLRTGTQAELFHANAYLQGIDAGRWRRIEYRSTRGEPLSAWLLLPPGYRPDRLYPLIAWVYPGRVFGDSTPDGSSVEDGDAFNFQVAAGRGYAVLFPSMPLGPYGLADDPMLRLPEGVMPAVDAAIAAGIADPQRLFLMGHSFGGFAADGLITQTNRFQAAVSMAGASDLTSAYGTSSGEDRYGEGPHNPTSTVSLSEIIETGQFHMESPPWADRDRYVRNSPVFAVRNVQTPLLLIHGDLDFLPIQQSEEYYSALTHEGKPAQFVRYLGEGHVLRSPANIRDMWRRVLGWFDRFGRIARDADGAMIWDGRTVRSAERE